MDAYDFIVCGAGTAGCLLANRLSAPIRASACCCSRPAAATTTCGSTSRSATSIASAIRAPTGCITPSPTPASTAAACAIRAARCWAAARSINGMIYMRGQARDYDIGRSLGNPGWSWAECLPLLHAPRGLPQGRRPVPRRARLRSPRTPRRRRMARREAAAALGDPRCVRRGRAAAGIPATDDFNRGDNEGVGYFEVNQRGGIRWNATKAFLRPIARRAATCEVWTGAHITRVLLEDADGAGRGCARPVSSSCAAASALEPRLRPGGEVVLAAGAIGTPQILQLSGIGAGRAAAAPRHRAAPRAAGGRREPAGPPADPRGVSRSKACKTLNTMAASWWGKALIGLEYLLRAQRPDEHGAVAARRLRAQPARAAAWPNLEYHVQPLSLEAFGEPLHRVQRLHRERLQPEPDQPRPGAASARPSPLRRRRSRRTTWRPTTTARSPPKACG